MFWSSWRIKLRQCWFLFWWSLLLLLLLVLLIIWHQCLTMVEVALTVARPDQKLCDRVTCVPKISSVELRMLLIFCFSSLSFSYGNFFFLYLKVLRLDFFSFHLYFVRWHKKKLANSPTTKTGRYSLLASTLDNQILDQH